MSSDDHIQPLFNSIPPVVVALALAILGVEVLISAGSRGFIGGAEAVGWRLEAIREFAFVSHLLDFVVERQAWTSPELKRFVTYPFIHLSFTHVIFVIVFLLALGKLVGEVFGNLSVLIVFFVSAICGAMTYALVTNDPRPLVGGYPGVYGLIGAYTFLLWVSYGVAGENQYRAFTLIGFLMGIQLVFGVLFGSSNDWVAEIAGFIAGFAISPILAPGGGRRLLDRLRQR